MTDASFQVLYFEVCPAKTKANFVHGFFIKYKELHINNKVIQHNNYTKIQKYNNTIIQNNINIQNNIIKKYD